LLFQSVSLWRVTFFVAAISLFHFLEFYITAVYNTQDATVSAFLLSSNGWAYNAAHGSAIFECLISHYFAPTGYSRWTTAITNNNILLAMGLVLIIAGQTIRSLAMAQAGSNFNHTVQAYHREGHVLVTRGAYRLLRHPSYFGFFWWGLGTQLVLQNTLCFWIYTFVLSSFFANRINREFFLPFSQTKILSRN
jgi:protein-S-isoprenylcysteine O-methyltransferase